MNLPSNVISLNPLITFAFLTSKNKLSKRLNSPQSDLIHIVLKFYKTVKIRVAF